MSKLLWKCQLIGPAALGAVLALSSTAIASDNKAPKQVALADTQEAAMTQVESSDSTIEVALDTEAAAAVTKEKAISVPERYANAPAREATVVPEMLGSDLELNTAEIQVEQLAQNFDSPNTDNTSEVLEEINRYSTENGNNSLGQGVEGAAKFRDVSPSDWAYQALDDLVKRYDCLVGYPNGTFRGNRALSRYEFAAGLNACLNQIERLIAAATADFVTKEDLETIRRLLQDFEAELLVLGTRVDNLEARTAFLEDHQFSTTTKLRGEVIFALTNNFGNDSSIGGVLNNVGEAAFGDRVRLEFNTSFTGRDRLVTRLAAGNLNPFRTGGTGTATNLLNSGSFEPTQTFNIGNTGNNDVIVDWLAYYFPFQGFNSLGVDNSYAYVAATGGIWSDIAPTTNPYFEDFDGGNGALSAFASENPIYRIGGGAGGAISFGFSPLESVIGPSTVTLGYLASEASNPGSGQGLLNGNYAALGQVNFNAFDTFAVGLTYVHSYHGTGDAIFDLGGRSSGVVGSFLANYPGQALGIGDTPTVTNSYGAEVAFRPTDWLSVSGFITKTDARLLGVGDVDIWTYGAGLALPDLGKEGNVLGFFAGIQPSLRGFSVAPQFNQSVVNALNTNRLQDGWHVEGFYKYQVTDNISITPGVIWLTRPNQNNNSRPAVIGTLRTTFTF